MDTYLVECFVPGIERTDVVAAAERVSAASAVARAAGGAIEYVAALLMPADEVVFHLFRSASADAVREACARAELPYERVLATEYFAAAKGES
jgi:hypothetical protein